MPVVVRSAAQVGPERCSVCHDDAHRREALDACLGCGSLAHEDCHRELTGCPTIGCLGVFQARVVKVTAVWSTASFLAGFVALWVAVGVAAACDRIGLGILLGASLGLALGANLAPWIDRARAMVHGAVLASLVLLAVLTFGVLLHRPEPGDSGFWDPPRSVGCMFGRAMCESDGDRERNSPFFTTAPGVADSLGELFTSERPPIAPARRARSWRSPARARRPA